MFLRILPPQDTPHYCSHTHQIAFKTHPDRENRSRWCIPARLSKRTDIGNMHRNCSKASLSLSASAIWHHTHTRRIYHHQWGINQPWGRSPRRHFMGCDKPTVASLAITHQGRLPACLWPTSQGRPAYSEYRFRGGLNGRIHLWHNHYYHWRTMLGGACQ